MTYRTYEEAITEARATANKLGVAAYVEKANEYGSTVYRTGLLPSRENRYGYELRVEAVEPERKDGES